MASKLLTATLAKVDELWSGVLELDRNEKFLTKMYASILLLFLLGEANSLCFISVLKRWSPVFLKGNENNVPVGTELSRKLPK